MKTENYILLKDLPDADKGTPLHLSETGDHYIIYESVNQFVVVYDKKLVENSPLWFCKESEYKNQKSKMGRIKELICEFAKSDMEVLTDKLRKLILQDVPQFEVSKELQGYYKKVMEKEIIGYRCPFDMLKGKIMKDDLYMQDHLNTEWFVCQGTAYNMPAELVKTWQPVYKEEEKITIGWYEVNISENKNGTIIDRLFLSREFWQSAYYTSQVMDFVFKYAGQDFILKSEYIKTILSKLK